MFQLIFVGLNIKKEKIKKNMNHKFTKHRLFYLFCLLKKKRNLIYTISNFFMTKKHKDKIQL